VNIPQSDLTKPPDHPHHPTVRTLLLENTPGVKERKRPRKLVIIILIIITVF